MSAIEQIKEFVFGMGYEAGNDEIADAVLAVEAENATLREALEAASIRLGELTQPPWVPGLTPLVAEVRDQVRAALAAAQPAAEDATA